MSGHRIGADLAQAHHSYPPDDGTLAPLRSGKGVPSDDEPGVFYIRTDPASIDTALYWNTGSGWTAVDLTSV